VPLVYRHFHAEMPHSFGYRARTRKLFAQPFRKHGPVPLSKYLTTYKIGDYVDIKANASIHKGMPFRFYHGRTGVIWNVTPRAVGVEINKQVRNRIVKKRIHVRVEHVQPSRCKEDFLNRVKANEAAKKAAKAKGVKARLHKRLPAQPKPGKIVKAKITEAETIAPLKYELLM
jgi:large subunit ribosomal protein L21e